MASTIATVNTSDKVLLIEPRKAYSRKTSIGSAWTDVRMGGFFTVVPSGNDDAASTAETLSLVSPLDQWWFGLKDSSSILPRTSGSQFMGFSCLDGDAAVISSNSAGSALLGGTTANWARRTTYNGATQLTNQQVSSSDLAFPIFSTTDVNAFWGLRFVVTDAGLSSQTVTIHYARSGTVQTTVTAAALDAKLRDPSSFTTGGSHTWNAAGAALPLPDYWFFANPFANNRIRVTTYGAVKFT